MVSPNDISGGNTPEEAAKIFSKIIRGEGTWAQNAVVFANAAMALQCSGKYTSYDDAYAAAVKSLESGKAHECLKKTCWPTVRGEEKTKSGKVITKAYVN
jgi:anthranilate phosphoribosyltransferase